MNGTQRQFRKTTTRKKRVMIRAKFAGSGKSFIGTHFNDLSYSTLFVVPHNMQKQDVPCDAVTQNTFFSVPVCKGESRLPKYDYTGYDVIFLDGIYKSSPYILNKIRVFCNENPYLIVIGAGDVKQLPSIEQPKWSGVCWQLHWHNFQIQYLFADTQKRVGGKDAEEGKE